MGNIHEDVLRIAREIEDYLEAHPRGTDTLTGVLTWWIAQQRFMEAKENVEQALDYLVNKGKVNRELRSDGTALYSKSMSDNEKANCQGQK
ncbi:MAG: hypothetical protein HKP58_01810 [Desulfatitalea sp.]|nr:hypothetical protein [Desulfatitalea sp.]NNJ99123.1 hypothetical protein [Desulfatitalea sp.]